MKENHCVQIFVSNSEEIEVSTNNKNSTNKKNKSVSQQFKPNHSKRVHFHDEVRVHKHALVLGDNPAVSDGVPLQLAWEAESTVIWKLQDHHDGRRRVPHRLSSYVRKVIASDQSSRECLVQVREEVRAIQKSRKESAHPKISLYEVFFPSKHLSVFHSNRSQRSYKSHFFFNWI